MLALSFGLPLVAPQSPSSMEIVTPAVARTFQPGNAESLTAALAAADELITPAARSEAERVARSFAPGPLAEQFAALIDQVTAEQALDAVSRS